MRLFSKKTAASIAADRQSHCFIILLCLCHFLQRTVINFANTGEMTAFDFQEKKIFCGRCRRFSPEMTEKMKSASFSEVDHLCLSLFEIERPAGRHGTVMVKYIGLLAVKSDGDAIPLCRATKYNLPLLLALLPDLAEKMGHLPITFPGDLHL